MSLASRLPYDHAYAGGYPGIGSQPLPTDADALDYLSRVKAADGAGVETGVAVAVDAFVKGCKADGIWTALKASCLLCGPRTFNGATTALVGDDPTPYNWSNFDYNRVTGLKGDGSTTYLDSNRAGDADGEYDRHVSVFVDDRGTKGGGARYIASGTGNTNDTFINNLSAGSVISAVSNPSYDTVAYSGGGFLGSKRSISTSFDFRVGGTTTPFSRTSGTPNAENFGIFCQSIGNLAFSDARLAFYSIGSAISDLALLDTRITAYVAAVAAALA